MSVAANKPVIAVTGAAGFIGSVVTTQLIDTGFRVRALTRQKQAAERLELLGAAVVRGGLDDGPALMRLTDDVDAVIHCAGVIRGANYADFEGVNVHGAQALIAVLAPTDTPCLALSSLAARKPMISDYARSKRAMERVFEASTLTRWAALRPPPVYGPGDRALGALFAAMARGVAPVPGPLDGRVSMLFVADLAAAVVAWLSADESPGGVYPLHDGKSEGYSWGDVIATAEQLRGKPIRRIPLSSRVLGPVARVNRALGRRLGYAPMLTPGKLRELRYPDWVCDNDAIQSVLRWQPRVRLADGLARTRRWQ